MAVKGEFEVDVSVFRRMNRPSRVTAVFMGSLSSVRLENNDRHAYGNHGIQISQAILFGNTNIYDEVNFTRNINRCCKSVSHRSKCPHLSEEKGPFDE